MSCRTGGRRPDRVFKVHLELPPGVSDEIVMRMIELSVIERIETLQKWEPTHACAKLDSASVKVLRRDPAYAEL